VAREKADVKQQFSSTEHPDWVRVDLSVFRDRTREIAFDLFLRVGSGNYVPVFSKTTGIDYKRLVSYRLKGVECLYVARAEESALAAYLSSDLANTIADPLQPQAKRVAALLARTEQCMSELFVSVGVPEVAARQTAAVVRSYVDLLSSEPQSLALLLRLASHGDYLYYHSLAVSIFSLFLAKAHGSLSRPEIEAIGLGAFLHDLGCVEFPLSRLNFEMDLQREGDAALDPETRDHPRRGLALLQDCPQISESVKFIVYQHHEEVGGQGYPNQLANSVIFYPAKIVAVADAFSAALSAPRAGARNRTPEEALALLRAQVGRFEPRLLELLEAVFVARYSRAQAA
jgi:HD-GYP domain-containing protein (c-di-GMP phosphodiesterase class II)